MVRSLEKMPRACQVQDHPARPLSRLGVQPDQAPIRLEVRPEVRRQMHLVVAVREQRVAQRGEDAGYLPAGVADGRRVHAVGVPELLLGAVEPCGAYRAYHLSGTHGGATWACAS
jgi:hypothetical protein